MTCFRAVAVGTAMLSLAARGAAAQCIAGTSPGFDFTPGARVLFATDFSQDKLGDFPAGLEFKTGAMEVSLWEGKRALKASAPSALLIPLAETLPDQFTVEVGVVNRNTKQVGAHTLKIYGGRIPLSDFATGATRVNVGTVFWEVTGGGAKAEAPMPEGTDDTCVGQFMNIRLSVDGPKLKVYADDKRIASIPNAQFLRARGLVIALEGRDDADNAVYVTSIRVAGGSPSGGNTVAAQPGPTATAPPGRTATLPPGTVASTPPRPTSSSPTTATTTATPTAPRTDPARDSMISAASAPDAAPAVAATDLVAISGYGNVWLKWQPAPNAVGYRIARWITYGSQIKLTGDAVLPDGTGLLTTPEFVDTLFPQRGQPYTSQSYGYGLSTYFRNAEGNYYFPDPSTEQVVFATPKDPNMGPSWAEETAQMTSIIGYADLHVHQMSNLGFGGRMLSGKAWGPPATALEDGVHGPNGILDVFGKTQGEGGLLPGHNTSGYPGFEGWPRSTTFTHQQVYETWLKRAVDGGLRLMVMYAVNNPVLCGAVERLKGNLNPQCGDMQAVQVQLDAAKAFEQYVDGQAGGAGRGWYRIVRSPAEARAAMRGGKLAVVLGTEVPGLFGCSETANCTDTISLRQNLEALYAQGVRQILPVHVFNNSFGGTAVASPVPAAANFIWNGKHLDLEDCSASGVRYRLTATLDPAIAAMLAVGFSPPPYPSGGHCNRKGLTPAGGFLLRDMMRLHMMVDVDHMGQNTFRDAMRLLRERSYPMVTSHVGFVALSPDIPGEGQDKRYEANKVQWQVDSLAAAGALISVITRQGTIGEVGASAVSTVVNDCDNSVKTFAQAYLHAVRAVRRAGGTDNGLTAVAFGSDFNGFNSQPRSRFGDEACDGKILGTQKGLQNQRVVYPFYVPVLNTRMASKSQLGTRTWDINEHGFAHIGLYPDFIMDLKNVGVSEADLKPLFYSAEAYVRLWERAMKYLPPTP